MILGYILIGWICGGLASVVYLTSADASALAALALFVGAGSATPFLAALAAALPCIAAPVSHAAAWPEGTTPRGRAGHARGRAPYHVGPTAAVSPWPAVRPTPVAGHHRDA